MQPLGGSELLCANVGAGVPAAAAAAAAAAATELLDIDAAPLPFHPSCG